MQIENFIFDLDGTLVDSQPGIVEAAARAMAEVLPGRAIPDFRPYIGPPIREIFAQALSVTDPDILHNLAAAYRAAYDTTGYLRCSVYPGMQEVLARLAANKRSCFVVTNKPKLPTARMLRHLELDVFFKATISPDSLMPSLISKTASLSTLLETEALNPSVSVMIGDSEDDALAASECHVLFMAATYGYGRASTTKLPIYRSLASAAEILTLL